jgi:hypothetical protein
MITEKSTIELEYPFSADVTLTIKELPVLNPMPESFTLVYTNNSDNKVFLYSAHFQIEKRLRDSWHEYENTEIYVDDWLRYLEPKSIVELECYVTKFLKDKGSGLYRIVCLVQDNDNKNIEIVACEFNLE